MIPTTKSTLRATVRANLEYLTPTRRDAKSLSIRNRLAETDAFQTARKSAGLMIYLSFGSEVQTTPLAFESPVIVPFCDGDEIVPFRICSPNDLEPGRFGILEPKPIIRNDTECRVSPEQISCVLVPGLAFDLSCNRLGRGKGYYDRLLSQLSPEIVLIGLAFECQVFKQIPAESWDHPVSLVVTENRIIIRTDSTLIHDKESAHTKFIKELS